MLAGFNLLRIDFLAPVQIEARESEPVGTMRGESLPPYTAGGLYAAA
jgi:hypothetical protein